MAQNSQDFDIQIKILIIGNSAVGKSCILMRYADNEFTMNFFNTIGVDFRIKTIEVEGQQCKIQIWDTAGQDRFRTITCSYYRGAHGIIIAYDITDRESFDNVKIWINEIEKHASTDVCKLLIGNKNDLEERRQVTFEEGFEFAQSLGIPFIETSAKDGVNVNEGFYKLAQNICNTQKKSQISVDARAGLKIKPKQQKQKTTQEDNCC